MLELPGVPGAEAPPGVLVANGKPVVVFAPVHGTDGVLTEDTGETLQETHVFETDLAHGVRLGVAIDAPNTQFFQLLAGNTVFMPEGLLSTIHFAELSSI